MASTLPQVASECCPPACDEVTSVQVPGAKGDDGEDGTDGVDGVSPFTTFDAIFTIPAELANDVATVADTSWMVISQKLYGSRVDGSVHAFFEVVAIGGPTSVTLKNLEDTGSSTYTENSAPASTLTIGSKLCPAGIQGPTGSISASAAGGDLKGTYPNPRISVANTKGSSLWGDGTNTVAVAAGTNGHMLAYDSTDAEGVKSFAALPLTGGTNVSKSRLSRLSSTTGLPIPLESTKAQINDPGSVTAGEKGAIVLDASSGNARGTDAIDLQVTRAGAAQVASGTNSTLGGGQDNTASGSASVVAGGNGNIASGVSSGVSAGTTNTASATGSFVGGGENNLANALKSIVGGGDSNAAGGQYSTVAGGSSNIASGDYSVVGGGALNSASVNTTIGGGANNDANGQYSTIPGGIDARTDLYGQMAHSSGKFSTVGDAQISEILMSKITANATPAELVLGASNGCPIASGRSFFFDIKLIAKRSDTSADAIYTSTGVIRNIAGTTTADAITTTEVFDGATLPATPVTVAADNANDTLAITVTGIAATTIHWLAVIRLLEVG